MSVETLRDRFAMQAMMLPGILKLQDKFLAQEAYRVADAMLKARGDAAPQPTGDAVKQQMLAALRGAQAWFYETLQGPPDRMQPVTAQMWQAVDAAIAAAEKEATP